MASKTIAPDPLGAGRQAGLDFYNSHGREAFAYADKDGGLAIAGFAGKRQFAVNLGWIGHPSGKRSLMKEPRASVVGAAFLGWAPRILVVEDEPAIGLLLTYNLEAEGYLVERVERGDKAESRLEESPPDLVILEWMLPDVSGFEICRRLRAREVTHTLPVLMLTARGDEGVRGLSIGSDDYVVKPFSVPELMARVRALLRRARPARAKARLSAGELELDRETRSVRRGGRKIHLGPTEFRLLEYLMEKPGQVFSRAQLLDSVWGAVRRDRRAHGRRPYRPPAESAGDGRRKQPDPHRARLGLFLRRDFRAGLNFS